MCFPQYCSKSIFMDANKTVSYKVFTSTDFYTYETSELLTRTHVGPGACIELTVMQNTLS